MPGIYNLARLGAKMAQEEIGNARIAQAKFIKELESGRSQKDVFEEGFAAQVDVHMERAREWQGAVFEALETTTR